MIKIQAQNAPWYDGIEIMLWYRYGDKMLHGVFHEPLASGIEGETKVEFVESNQNERLGSTFILRYDIAQLLMNELWHCGLRPANEVGGTGELRATQSHLEDMRKQNDKLLDRVLDG